MISEVKTSNISVFARKYSILRSCIRKWRKDEKSKVEKLEMKKCGWNKSVRASRLLFVRLGFIIHHNLALLVTRPRIIPIVGGASPRHEDVIYPEEKTSPPNCLLNTKLHYVNGTHGLYENVCLVRRGGVLPIALSLTQKNCAVIRKILPGKLPINH